MRSNKSKTDCERLEQRLRAVFDDLPKNPADWDFEYLKAVLLDISDIIGEETGRGFPLED